jgi:hypothetical protein
MKERKRKRSIKSSKNSPKNPLNQWKVEATINYLETKKGSILEKKTAVYSLVGKKMCS